MMLVLAGACAPGPARGAGASTASNLLDDPLAVFAPAQEIPDTPRAFQPVATSRSALRLTVVHVKVPRESAAAMARTWSLLDEGVVAVDVRSRLSRNGLRIGAGKIDAWPTVKTFIERVPGYRIVLARPMQVPLGFSVALELDQEPRDQTLFVVGFDGVLSGRSFPATRNVLRVEARRLPQYPDELDVVLAPEVRQPSDNWRWVHTGVGVEQVPDQKRWSFAPVSARVRLARDEFLLLSAAEPQSAPASLLGPTMLSSTADGIEYASFLFIRPEAQDVGSGDE